MLRTVTLGVALIATVGLYEVAASANGSAVDTSSSSSSSGSSAGMSTEEMAKDAYNSGIDHRDKGRKLEDQAAAQTAQDRDKTLAKAKDEFSKALKDFKSAADMDPTLYQAVNGMAYAYRKTGDPAKALQMYDLALKMAPNFPDAIEYRGEAYLDLNRVDDAKAAYLTLFGLDRKQADQLLKSMSTWVSKHQSESAGDPQGVAALDTWIKERAKIASTTTAMSIVGNRSIWN